MQQDQPERDGDERSPRRAHVSSHHPFPDNASATSSATRATGDTARSKVETVTRKDATRKQADGSDQKDSKTPSTRADDGYEMRDDASTPYENDSRNISKGSFDDKEKEMKDFERVRGWINEMLLGGFNQAPAEPPRGLLADWWAYGEA